MSQAGDISAVAGPVPPAVATSYVTDVNSPAVPALNILNVYGNDTVANDQDGVRTDGSSGSNTLTVQLTNRATGTLTSVGATTTTIIAFDLSALIGVVQVNIEVVGFDSAAPAGVGYAIFGTARSTGAAVATIGTPTKVVNEEASLVTADVDVTPAGTFLNVEVTGVAGRTINWFALLTYIYVG